MDENVILARNVFSGRVPKDTSSKYLLNEEGQKRVQAIVESTPDDLREKYSYALQNHEVPENKKFIDAFERNISVKNENGAPPVLRFLIKNFGNDVNSAIEAADKWGYEAKPSVYTMRDGLKGGLEGINLDIRPKGSNGPFKRLDKLGPDIQDATDLFADAIQTAADIVATPTKVTGAPGMALAGAVSAGTEAIRQGLGVAAGVNKEVNPNQIAAAGEIGTLIPAAGPIARGLGSIAKDTTKLGYRMARGISKESLDFLSDNPEIIKIVEEMGQNATSSRQELARRTAESITDARSKFVTKINDEISSIIKGSDNANKTVDAGPILKELDYQIKSLNKSTVPKDRAAASELMQVRNNLLQGIGDDKRIFASELDDLRSTWNRAAESSYDAQAGVKLPLADSYAAIARSSREALDVIDPKIRKLNGELADLFDHQDKLSRFKFSEKNIPANGIENIFNYNLKADEAKALDKFVEKIGLVKGGLDNPEFAKKAAKVIKEIDPENPLSQFATGRSLLPIVLGSMISGGTGGVVGGVVAAPIMTKPIVGAGTMLTRGAEATSKGIGAAIQATPQPIRRGIAGIISRDVGRNQ